MPTNVYRFYHHSFYHLNHRKEEDMGGLYLQKLIHLIYFVFKTDCQAFRNYLKNVK